MENNNDTSVILTIINLIHAYLKRLCDLVELASLEAKLAVKTLFNLTILFYIVTLLLISSWLSLLFLIFTFIVSLHYTPVIAASVITLINIVLLGTCCFTIWKIKRNLFFPATLRQLHSPMLTDKDMSHEQSKTTN